MPVLILVGILFTVDAVFRLDRWRKRQQRRRSPLTAELLRGPGETTRSAIDELQLDLVANIFLAVIVPLLAYSSYLSLVYFRGTSSNRLSFAIFALSSVAACVYGAVRALRSRHGLDNLRQGLDGEIVVAQELNQLMREGFWVYHDVPAKGFNIDHVVVGDTGVFAIETKARRKPTTNDSRADASVEYDGECLKFPGWIDSKSLAQAQRQAGWLKKWLQESTGEQGIPIYPVLALPGWYVKVTANLSRKPNAVVVINPKNRARFRKGAGNLSQAQIQRIVFQLDRQCRDVERFEAGRIPDDSDPRNELADKVRDSMKMKGRAGN